MAFKDINQRKQYYKIYYENNKQKLLNYGKEYYKNNKENISQWKKDYYLKNKEHIIEDSKKYYQDNRLEIRFKYNQYRHENIEKFIIHNQKRRAKQKALINDFTLEEWELTKEYFNYKCAYCGSSENICQDHFIPLSKQGDYTLGNIIPSCNECNLSKHTQYFEDWYPKQSFYNEENELYILNWVITFYNYRKKGV